MEPSEAVVSNWRRLAVTTICLLLALTLQGWAQQSEPMIGAAQSGNSPADSLSNSGSASATTSDAEQPLTTRGKMILAAKSSVDWSMFAFNGGVAYLYYTQRVNPSFGYGWGGYGKRFAAATADSTIGNMLGVGIFPSLLHEDPRYVRSGTGTIKSRIAFSMRQTISAPTDSGRWRFPYSQWLGAGAALGISNLYYRDSRTVPANVEKFSLQIAGNAGLDVLQEFWPDIQRRLFTHHR